MLALSIQMGPISAQNVPKLKKCGTRKEAFMVQYIVEDDSQFTRDVLTKLNFHALALYVNSVSSTINIEWLTKVT